MSRDTNYILEDNLRSAIKLAIEKLKADEARNGPNFISCFRQGLMDVVNDERPIKVRSS